MRVNYKIGQTKVAVYQTDERGQTKRIHSGIVIAERENWLRVYNPESPEKGWRFESSIVAMVCN